MAFFARENIAVPDENKGQILYKWPDELIRRFTQAIVAPDETAVFMFQGKIVTTLGPGRYRLDAKEIPGLGLLKDITTGDDAYRTELYYVGTHEYTEQKFGGEIDNVQDPVSGLIVKLRVFGEYSVQVTDPTALILKLAGTVDISDNQAITEWVAEQLMKVMRNQVTNNVVSGKWAVLGLATHLPEIETTVISGVIQQLQTYGLSIPRLGNFDITLSDEDQEQLKKFAKDTAYSRLAGSFGQYAAGELQIGAGQGMSQGNGGTNGAFLAAGLGVGQQAIQPAPVGQSPPPAPEFAGSGGAYAPAEALAATQPAVSTVACPSCQASSIATAIFCSSCGAKLVPQAQKCVSCGETLATNAKFCANCGTAISPPSAGTTP